MPAPAGMQARLCDKKVGELLRNLHVMPGIPDGDAHTMSLNSAITTFLLHL